MQFSKASFKLYLTHTVQLTFQVTITDPKKNLLKGNDPMLIGVWKGRPLQ